MSEFFQKESIQFVGLEGEDEFETTKAKTTAQKIFEKIKKIHPGDKNLVVHIKRHEVEGTRKKYSIIARLRWPGNFFEAKHEDWEFLSTTQAALHTLLEEVKKKHAKQKQKQRMPSKSTRL